MKHSSDFVTIVNESRPTADTPADSQDQNLVDSLVRRIKSFQSYQITEVMSTSTTDVKKIYKEIVQGVCESVREALSDEGFDEHTLQELKTLWTNKLEASRALEPLPTSAVDESATRANRSRTTNHNDTNQATTITNRQMIPQRTGGIQVSHINQGGHTNIAYSTSSNMNIMHGSNIGAAQVFTSTQRPAQPNRSQFNPITLTNSHMRTPNQTDGAHDECPLPKVHSKRKQTQAKNVKISIQLDGTGPTVSDDEEDDDDNEIEGNDDVDDPEDDDDDEGNEEGKEDPNPLNSDDDISGDDPNELFETDNVIVCQYEKISRTKNKWRFTLKSGVMNISGRDYIFNKATGDADW